MSDPLIPLRYRLVGRFLRSARVSAGLTQLDVTNALGYTTAQFCSNWERGISIPPENSACARAEGETQGAH